MGTHYPGTPEEHSALSTFINLVRATDSLHSRLAPTISETGLTDSQFGILEALLHLGPLCQRELGKKILKSSGNITMVVDNLEKQGLVERQRNRDDRRFITVHLTQKGNALIGELFPRHVANLCTQMNILSPSEQDTLRALCRKLGRQQLE